MREGVRPTKSFTLPVRRNKRIISGQGWKWRYTKSFLGNKGAGRCSWPTVQHSTSNNSRFTRLFARCLRGNRTEVPRAHNNETGKEFLLSLSLFLSLSTTIRYIHLHQGAPVSCKFFFSPIGARAALSREERDRGGGKRLVTCTLRTLEPWKRATDHNKLPISRYGFVSFYFPRDYFDISRIVSDFMYANYKSG